MYCVHTYMVQRPLDYADIDQDHLERIQNWFETQKEAKDNYSVAKCTDGNDKRIWAESITMNPKMLPRAYVLRPEPDPLVVPVDEGWGNPDFNQELMSCGRHDGTSWAGDNRAVFDFLKDKTFGTTAWHTIKSFERAGWGREAFLALIALYLGSDVIELLMKEAEAGLNSITFDGSNKNFTFDKYVSKLGQYFLDLNCTDIPEAHKIKKLMDSLNIASLGNVYPIIKASPQYRNDFDVCVVYVQDQLAALATKHAGKRSISFAKRKETSEEDKEDKVQPWSRWTKGGGRGGRGGPRGQGGRGGGGGRGGD